MAASGEMVAKSASGAGLLVVLVIVQRIGTFVMNTLVTRAVGAEILGFASSDMELLLATLLFLSREAFRLVAIRIHVPKEPAQLQARLRAEQELRNVAFAPVPIGLAMCAAAMAWVVIGQASTGLDDARTVSAALFICGAAIETLAEPMFINSLHRLQYSTRVSAEGLGMLVKCVATFSLVLLDWGVVAFGAAQLLYAITVFSVFALSMARAESAGEPTVDGLLALYQPCQLPPASTDGDDKAAEDADVFFGCCRRSTQSLLQTFTVQSGIKHLLTEGNRLILLTAPAVVRGEFAAVANYGSLAVRILLQPTEDAARTMFAKLSGNARLKTSSDDAPDKRDVGKDGARLVSREAITDAHLAMELLILSLRLVGTLGVIIAALGPPYCATVVKLLLGPKWQATDVAGGLATFCIYVLCLAINGVAEAFVMATAPQETIATLNATMAFTYGVYVLLALGDPFVTGMPGLLEMLGIRGLILADCVNMLLRAGAALSFAHARTAELLGTPLQIGKAMPSMTGLLVLVAAAIATRYSEASLLGGPFGNGRSSDLHSLLVHVGVGVICGLAVLAVLYLSDGTALRAAWSRVRGSSDKEKEE